MNIVIVVLITLLINNLFISKFIGLDYNKIEKKFFYNDFLFNICFLLLSSITFDRIIYFYPVIFHLRIPLYLLIGFFLFFKIRKIKSFISIIVLHVYFVEKTAKYDILNLSLEILIAGLLFILFKRAFIALKTRLKSEDVPSILKGEAIELFCMFFVAILFYVFVGFEL